MLRLFVILTLATAAMAGPACQVQDPFSCFKVSFCGPSAGCDGVVATVDVSSCKSTTTLSWFACLNDKCTVMSCKGTTAADKVKCNDASGGQFCLPAGSTSLSLQVHDGQIGSATDGCATDCRGGKEGGCGSDSTYHVTLQSFPVVIGSNCGGCQSDSECGAPSSPCVAAQCQAGKCVEVNKAAGTECGPAGPGACDAADTCDGNGLCVDNVQPKEHQCRAADGVCDTADFCDGQSKECADGVQAASFECRAADGPCDVADFCDGSAKICGADNVQAATFTCREATGVCDVSEQCDGEAKSCPADGVKARGTTCRAKKDGCDIEERCDGSAKTCAVDTFFNFGYTFKCSTTCYLCGVEPSDLSKVTKNSYKVGSCGTGSCDTFVQLPYPQCVDQSIPAVCANNRGLSNAVQTQCVAAGMTETWNCLSKLDGSAITNGVTWQWP
jgi:hypothetical protein